MERIEAFDSQLISTSFLITSTSPTTLFCAHAVPQSFFSFLRFQMFVYRLESIVWSSLCTSFELHSKWIYQNPQLASALNHLRPLQTIASTGILNKWMIHLAGKQSLVDLFDTVLICFFRKPQSMPYFVPFSFNANKCILIR